MLPLTPTTVLGSDRIGQEGYVLTYDRRAPFRAGQVVGITTDPAIPPRLYSIASGEQDRDIQVLFTVIQEGAVTPALSDCLPGDRIFVTEPHGTFYAEEANAWWIAAGTGIAPFRSMLRSGLGPGCLLHGARRASGLYFREEFSRLSCYVPCVSRPTDPSVPPVRLTDFLGRQLVLPREVAYYLCGSTNMVIDVRALLIEKGVPFERIITEIYF